MASYPVPAVCWSCYFYSRFCVHVPIQEGLRVQKGVHNMNLLCNLQFFAFLSFHLPVKQTIFFFFATRLWWCYHANISFVFCKVTAVRSALSSANQGQKSDSILAKPLKSQAFASPDKVAEVVQKVNFQTTWFLTFQFILFLFFALPQLIV